MFKETGHSCFTHVYVFFRQEGNGEGKPLTLLSVHMKARTIAMFKGTCHN